MGSLITPHSNAFHIGKVIGYLCDRLCDSDPSYTASATSPIRTTTGTPLGSSPPEVNDVFEAGDPALAHDASRFQCVSHIRNIIRICMETPHVLQWLPRRESETGPALEALAKGKDLTAGEVQAAVGIGHGLKPTLDQEVGRGHLATVPPSANDGPRRTGSRPQAARH